MRLYDGFLVHQSVSDDGVIEVVDTGATRSMHFGTFPRQSCMSLETPHTLELSYTEAMMAALLLNPQPEKVLVIGLGGGSLLKFLLHHFPDCQIDVVEYRSDVIRVAHQYFDVPEDDPRVSIQLGDGYLYAQQRCYQDNVEYDMVLVDAYDHAGMAASVGVPAFFDACAGLLSLNGVMSINLWGSNRPMFKMMMERINQSFKGQSMILPVEDKGNIIGLATKKQVSQSALKQLKVIVDELELQFDVNLPRSLRDLTKRNRPFIGRLLF